VDSYQNSSNVILITNTFDVINYNKQNPLSPMRILPEEERFMRVYEGFHTTQDYFLMPSLMRAIEQLKQNGIIDRIMAKYYDKSYIYPPPPEGEPEVLTLGQTAFAFKLLAICVSFSFAVFVVEVDYKKIWKWMRKVHSASELVCFGFCLFALFVLVFTILFILQHFRLT